MRFVFFLLLLVCTSSHGQGADFDPIDFKSADSIAAVFKGESLKNLPVLTHKLTANLVTEVEKFRAIYTWVSTNIENDYDSYLRTSKKRKKLADNREAYLDWNSSFTPKVFNKLIRDRKTACTGYAYLVREMAGLAGFDCKIVNGYGRTPTLQLKNDSPPNHSWNAIGINGKWYLCDATWSAGRVMFEEEGPIFKNDYYDGYFLADPALFIKNHYPLESDLSLLSKPPSYAEFVEGPVVYKEAFGHNIIPMTPSKMRFETTVKEPVSFTLQLPESVNAPALALLLNNGGRNKKVAPQMVKHQKTCTLVYAFEKTGLYDVHIQLDNMLVATYVVRVRRK